MLISLLVRVVRPSRRAEPCSTLKLDAYHVFPDQCWSDANPPDSLRDYGPCVEIEDTGDDMLSGHLPRRRSDLAGHVVGVYPAAATTEAQVLVDT